MSKTLLNFVLDSILAFSFLAVLWSATALQFVFPPAFHAQGWSLWGWNYEQWARFQFLSLCIVAVLILLHVMLHWSWVCGVATQRLGKRLGRKITLDDSHQTIVGVGMLIGLLHLLGVFYLSALLTVRPAPADAGGPPSATILRAP